MSAFIILAVLILLFTAFFFIGKISETSMSIRKANATDEGDDSYDDMEYVSNINGYLSLAFMVGFLFLSFYGTLHYLPRMIPKLANSIHGQELDKMFMRTYYITAAIFLITHVVLFAFVFMYRYKRNRKAYFFSHSNTLEIIWTTIPAIAMAYLVYTGIIAWNETFTKDNSFTEYFGEDYSDKMPITMEVTGYQFGWKVRYPGVDGSLGNRVIDDEHINEFYATYSLPNELGIDWQDDSTSHDDLFVDDTVRFVKGHPAIVNVGALDVLHSFYLPHFRIKMDCVPGTPNQIKFIPLYSTDEYREILSKEAYWQEINEATGQPRWETFNFELACTELCGASHWAMQKYVKVYETMDEFYAWQNAQTPYYLSTVEPAIATVDSPTEEEVEEDEVSIEMAKN